MPGGEHYRTMMCLFHLDAITGKQLKPSKVFTTLHEQFRKCLAIGSTSSGTFTVTHGPLLTGGSDVYRCIKDGGTPDARGLKAYLTYDPNGGLSFCQRSDGGIGWNSALFDAHGPEKARILRLCRLVCDTRNDSTIPADQRTSFAVAIGENTQVCLDKSTGWADIQGESSVQFADLTSCEESNTGAWGVRDILFHQLTRGDKFNFNTGQVEVAAWKQAQQPSASDQPLFVSSNVCAEPHAIGRSAESLMRNAAELSVTSTSQQLDPQYKVSFTKCDASALYTGTEPDPSAQFQGVWSTVVSVKLSIVGA